MSDSEGYETPGGEWGLEPVIKSPKKRPNRASRPEKVVGGRVARARSKPSKRAKTLHCDSVKTAADLRDYVSECFLSDARCKKYAYRGGVYRMTKDAKKQTALSLGGYIFKVMQKALILAGHSRRKTICSRDVVGGLHHSGTTMYRTGSD